MASNIFSKTVGAAGRANNALSQLKGGKESGESSLPLAHSKTLPASNSSERRKSLLAEPAHEKHPDCKLCNSIKEEVAKDKKKFLFETEHLRNGIRKCLELLATYMRGNAYTDFEQSLQLDVRYISEHIVEDDIEGDYGGDGADGANCPKCGRLEKRLKKLEDQIDMLESENMKLSSLLELHGIAIPTGFVSGRKTLANAGSDKGNLLKSLANQGLPGGGNRGIAGGPSAHGKVGLQGPTDTDQVGGGGSSSHGGIGAGAAGGHGTDANSAGGGPARSKSKFGGSKDGDGVSGGTGGARGTGGAGGALFLDEEDGVPGSPKLSASKEASAQGKSEIATAAGQQASLAKSALAGLDGRALSKSKSLWGDALASIKLKKKKDDAAELFRMKKELEAALERANKAEKESKDALHKLHHMEEELKKKNDLLERTDRHLKLAENKNKKLQAQKGIGSKAISVSATADGKDKSQSDEHSIMNSDAEDFDDEGTQFRSAPIKGGTGCVYGGTFESPSASLTGKLYEKRIKSVPQLIPVGKAKGSSKTMFEKPWVEPYLKKTWNTCGSTRGPSISPTNTLPFAATWSSGFNPLKDSSIGSRALLGAHDAKSEHTSESLAELKKLTRQYSEIQRPSGLVRPAALSYT